MIFVVEDEPPLRRSIVEFLQAKGLEARGFEDAESALGAIEQSPPDAVVSDLQLPGMQGLELLEKTGALDPAIVRVVMTAYASTGSVVAAMRMGCHEYLEKPLDLPRLERILRRALDERRSQRELSWLRAQSTGAEEWGRLVGDSAAMHSVRREIQVLAELQGERPPLLILGETGVGKGLLARVVHEVCHGTEAPFMDVNCAAIPENLVEAELFGHERSAFTDAREARAGLFEAAAGGTVFLDEIGEIADSVQAKLLKVVETGRVRRLGGTTERPLDVHIIAASNKNLQAEASAGRFRLDLFHRLAAFRITLPPLRERGDDVNLLAQLFVQQASQRYRKQVRDVDDDVRSMLSSFDWPGNVRELRFAIERAVIRAPENASTLRSGMLSGIEPVRSSSDPHRTSAQAQVSTGEGGISVRLPPQGVAFEEIEKAVLLQALQMTRGNVMQAADLLHLSRDTMRYRMRKHDLSSAAIDKKSGHGTDG